MFQTLSGFSLPLSSRLTFLSDFQKKKTLRAVSHQIWSLFTPRFLQSIWHLPYTCMHASTHTHRHKPQLISLGHHHAFLTPDLGIQPDFPILPFKIPLKPPFSPRTIPWLPKLPLPATSYLWASRPFLTHMISSRWLLFGLRNPFSPCGQWVFFQVPHETRLRTEAPLNAPVLQKHQKPFLINQGVQG